MNRKTTPKVIDGKVQKKNRHKQTQNYWNTRQDVIRIDIEKPGKGYKHYLKKRDIIKFLEILPNHDEIDIEFNAVLLAMADGPDGWYSNGVVGICAWDKNPVVSFSRDYYEEHRNLFERLGVDCDIKKTAVVCRFTENQVKAYQLLHIFLHEIGYHHDRINTKDKIGVHRGEKYAESYALKYEKIIWKKYFETFEK